MLLAIAILSIVGYVWSFFTAIFNSNPHIRPSILVSPFIATILIISWWNIALAVSIAAIVLTIIIYIIELLIILKS